MIKSNKVALFSAILLCSSCFAESEPEILHLPFNEQNDLVEDNRKNPPVQALLGNVQWALGDFGRALYFCGTNAFVDIDSPAGLNGADEFTLSIRVLWRGSAKRQYPNILTSRTWSPGGIMIFVNNGACSFRMGRPNVKGKGWQETSASFLSRIPENQWTHLCVTFKRPLITTYVNGKKVATAKWNYSVQCDDLRLGGWSTPVCHSGLIDDLRIYNRALTSDAIEELANNRQYTSTAFTVHPSKPLPAIAEFVNNYVSMGIDKRGRLSKLSCIENNHSLLAASSPLVTVTQSNGRRLKCDRASAVDKNCIRFTFVGIKGYVDLRLTNQGDFFDIEVAECTIADVERLTFFEILSAVNKYRGSMANMLSDDEYGVCLRGYDLPVEMHVGGNSLRLQTTKALGLTGWRGGVAVGRKSELSGILKKMTLHAKVPFSTNGGAWSLSSEANKGSYLFANLSLASVDDWIALADRCGYETIHLHAWWARLGHYPVNKTLFPNGESDLKKAVDKIHAAGLKAGMHTLTACINPQDSWVTPKPHPDLLAANSYTLAKELPVNADVVYVKELPVSSHDIVFTYSGNGNALRIGDEIIQYTGINRTEPYSFTGCKRGAFGTTPSSYAAGRQIDYLQQRYYAFYPKPDSALAEDLASRLAHIFNSCNIDSFYFDGSEGMRSRYGIDFMRHCIMKKLRKDAVIEASCHGAHNWWFHSRLGAWDHPVWGMKRFHDKHIAIVKKYRKSDLMATQLGWWAPRSADSIARGHYLEEMEYFACKNLAMDTASSIQGVNVSSAPLSSYIEKQMTILGWYEKLRRAGYFDVQTIERIAEPGKEFELRQQSDGEWKFTPVEYSLHRTGEGRSAWQVTNASEKQPLSLRIAALQRALPYDSDAGITLLSADNRAELKLKTANSSVEINADAAESTRFKNSIKLKATNKGSSPVGAWARVSRSFAPDYLDISKTGAIGVWINGDASGALLNVQLESPREHMHAYSEHYVMLDFKGWHYFELHFRERDARLYSDYVWPYSSMSSIYRNPLNRKYLSAVNLYLNNIPAGGSSEVVVSPVIALPVKNEQIVNPVIKINSKLLTLPLTLNSGDFAEIYQDKTCTLFNAAGDPLENIMIDQLPKIKQSVNDIELLPDSLSKIIPRAEITTIIHGAQFGTMNPLAEIKQDHLKRCYDMPKVFMAGEKESQWTTASRGNRVLEIELHGAVSNPIIYINDLPVSFGLSLNAGDRLICRDQQNWKVINSKREIIAQGSLKNKIPSLHAGENKMGFKCEKTTGCRLNVIKLTLQLPAS